jgi:soluble cytochrome b562
MLRYLPLLVCTLLMLLVACHKEAKLLTQDEARQQITELQIAAHEKCGNTTPDGDCVNHALSTADARQLRAGLTVVMGLLDQARAYNDQGDTETATAALTIVDLALDRAREIIK